MSVDVKLRFSEDVLLALHTDAEGFARELKVAAAIKWYEMGLVSQEKAAEIAGLSRAEFISELSRYRVSPFQYTAAEVEEELKQT